MDKKADSSLIEKQSDSLAKLVMMIWKVAWERTFVWPIELYVTGFDEGGALQLLIEKDCKHSAIGPSREYGTGGPICFPLRVTVTDATGTVLPMTIEEKDLKFPDSLPESLS